MTTASPYNVLNLSQDKANAFEQRLQQAAPNNFSADSLEQMATLGMNAASNAGTNYSNVSNLSSLPSTASEWSGMKRRPLRSPNLSNNNNNFSRKLNNRRRQRSASITSLPSVNSSLSVPSQGPPNDPASVEAAMRAMYGPPPPPPAPVPPPPPSGWTGPFVPSIPGPPPAYMRSRPPLTRRRIARRPGFNLRTTLNNGPTNNEMLNMKRLRTQSQRVSNSLARSLELLAKVAKPSEALNMSYNQRERFATIFYDKYQKEFRAYFKVGSDLFVIKAVDCDELLNKMMNSEKIVEDITKMCGPVPASKTVKEHIKDCIDKDYNITMGKQRNISKSKLNALSSALNAKAAANKQAQRNKALREKQNNNLTQKIIKQIERSARNAKGRELVSKVVTPKALATVKSKSRRNRIQARVNNYISKGTRKSFLGRLFGRK